ncbi:MAG TPA: Uma2 family endonuclease [Kofleriaceae bacterium]|nr:Uma2 family endonuclease [Kofleriaceae bacterium]
MVAPALVEDDLRMTLVARWRDLPMRLRLARPLGHDELFEFCAANRDLRIERTADGELLIRSPTGGETGRRNFDLIGQFAAWVKRDGTGLGFDSSTGVPAAERRRASSGSRVGDEVAVERFERDATSQVPAPVSRLRA